MKSLEQRINKEAEEQWIFDRNQAKHEVIHGSLDVLSAISRFDEKEAYIAGCLPSYEPNYQPWIWSHDNGRFVDDSTLVAFYEARYGFSL